MNQMDDEERKERVELEVGSIRNSGELHLLLQEGLDFPDYYGMNWDAFWDAITGLVELPETVVFIGWERMMAVLPNDARMLSDMFTQFNEEHPLWECEVKYE
ncbi:MAG: barstar family protein [Candidatus Pristimantibacillus sp.]